jgi:small subunit ribosomal protein S13
MLYLFEAELSENKRVSIALNQIYGLNKFYSNKVIRQTGLSNNFKLKLMTNEQVSTLVKTINSLDIKISTNLKKHQFSMFKRIIDLRSIKSIRLNKGLPVRGQRTHTNAKTARKKLHFIST